MYVSYMVGSNRIPCCNVQLLHGNFINMKNSERRTCHGTGETVDGAMGIVVFLHAPRTLLLFDEAVNKSLHEDARMNGTGTEGLTTWSWQNTSLLHIHTQQVQQKTSKWQSLEWAVLKASYKCQLDIMARCSPGILSHFIGVGKAKPTTTQTRKK